MARQHEKHDFVRGDTWKIYGTIRDDRGALLDVTTIISDIKWVLVASDYTRTIDVDVAVVTAVDADQGEILITVDEADTEDVPAGRYTDFCWIELPDGRRTKWFGEIWVQAGPPPATP